MKMQILYLIAILLISSKQSWGQSLNESNLIETDVDVKNRYEWLPTLLSASSNTLYNTIVFNGAVFSWSWRGANNSVTLIDGIDWSSSLKKWKPADLFAGMVGNFQINQIAVAGDFSDLGYSIHPNLHSISTQNQVDNETLLVRAGFANNSLINNLSAQYSFRINKYKWRSSLGLALQVAPVGLLPSAYKNRIAVHYNINKQFSNHSYLGFSFIWNDADQSKATTIANESYRLSGQKTYNPNWGWYHQQMYFPGTKQNNAPAMIVSFQKKWNENNSLQVSNGLVVGSQSQSNLEWTHSANPRPDYYRYLPSYIADTTMQSQLTLWLQTHPAAMQINFDQLEKINQSAHDKQSFYIISQQNSDLLLLHGSLLYSKKWNSNTKFLSGVHYAIEQIHYYNTIKDLLGGTYFFNYNNWLNDDGQTTSFQNDILHPDQKIKLGQKWGANYKINDLKFKPWLQFSKEGSLFETALGMAYGLQTMKRIGLNANGLFPNNSKGDSRLLVLPSWDFKVSLLYKISGRHYLRSILFTEFSYPDNEDVYLDPEISATVSSYHVMVKQQGIDLSYFYRSPVFKATVAGFWKNKNNGTEQNMFYHDAYSAFVYGLAGNIQTESTGLETCLETQLLSNIQLVYVNTLQKNVYANNPEYQLLFVNDLHLLEHGILQLKNLPSTGSPAVVNAVSVAYLPSNTIRMGCTILFAQNRPVILDIYRRSSQVKNQLDAISWGRMVSSANLPDNWTSNLFLSTSFQIKKIRHPIKVNTSLSIRNALNAFIPIFLYEQTRFDYVHFNANKYAVKYLLDQGTSYTLRFQLQSK